MSIYGLQARGGCSTRYRTGSQRVLQPDGRVLSRSHGGTQVPHQDGLPSELCARPDLSRRLRMDALQSSVAPGCTPRGGHRGGEIDRCCRPTANTGAGTFPADIRSLSAIFTNDHRTWSTALSLSMRLSSARRDLHYETHRLAAM